MASATEGGEGQAFSDFLTKEKGVWLFLTFSNEGESWAIVDFCIERELRRPAVGS